MVTNIAPRNHIISSCNFHFGNLTNSNFLLSIAYLKSSLFSLDQNIFLRASIDRS